MEDTLEKSVKQNEQLQKKIDDLDRELHQLAQQYQKARTASQKTRIKAQIASGVKQKRMLERRQKLAKGAHNNLKAVLDAQDQADSNIEQYELLKHQNAELKKKIKKVDSDKAGQVVDQATDLIQEVTETSEALSQDVAPDMSIDAEEEINDLLKEQPEEEEQVEPDVANEDAAFTAAMAEFN